MSRMNRRRFVAVTSVTATSVLLVACGNDKLSEEELNPTQIPDVAGAPPTIAPLTSTPGAAADEPATDGGDSGSGASEAIAIEAHDDFSFSPNEVEVAPGQTVTLTNTGFAQHDLYVEEWDLGTELLNNGQSGEIVIPEDAEVGAQFVFYCTVVGHRQSGMEGTFTIVEAGAAAPAGEEEAAGEEAPAEEGAATGSTEAIAIEAHDDFSFSPNEVEVAPGQTVTLTNTGFAQHDLYVEEWDLGTELLNNGQSGEIVIPEDAEVGAQFVFYCTVVGHRQSGMEGTFTIVEAGAAAPAGGSEEEAEGEEAPAEEGAATGSTEAIAIEAHDDFSFSPNEVEVAPGQTVTLTNTGFAQHDLYVDEWELGTELLNNGQSGEIVIPEDAEVGAQFVFYCTVVGHRQSGMEGTFTIVEAGAAAPAGGSEEEAAGEEAPAEEGAATGSTEAIAIEAHDDFSFSPNEVEVAPGQTVTLTNTGFAQHDLYVDEWELGTELLNNGQSGEIVIPEDAEVGAQFVFYCTVVGHRQSGMEGTFTIVEAGAAAPAGGTDEEAEGEATAAPEGTPDADAAGLTADNNPQAVTVVGTQWQYEPAEFEIAPGGVITFQNETGMMMGMSSETWDDGAIPMIRSVGDGSSGEFTVPADAEVGSTVTIKSNLTEAENQGMVATVTIVEGDGSVAASPEASPAAEASGDAIEVKMLDTFAFEPADFEAAVGATIHFVNEGFMQHDAKVDEWSDEPLTPLLNNGETFDAVIPDTAVVGEQYEYYCTVPGHEQSGMKGIITIV